MDTSAKLDLELRASTVERKNEPGYRCLGKQRDGNFALSVGVPTACFTAEQLHNLADVIDRFGSVGHLSTAQSVIVVGIPEASFYEAKQAVLAAGFEVRSIGRDVRQVKCCPGADFSPFGLQRTFPMATRLEEEFRGLPTPMKFKISVSGCPNCCANTMMNDFGIHGMVGGWKVFVGGKMGTQPAIAQEVAANVHADDVPKYLAATLRAYRELAESNERLAKTIARIGFDAFKQKIQQFIDRPYDELIREARAARAAAQSRECVGPLGS